MRDATVCDARNKRNLGIDLLKAALAIMIMMRHSAILSVTPMKDAGIGLAPFIKFMYFAIQTMCVPSFLVVSLYFYTQKRGVNKSYFKKRITRLAQIICFWWPVYYVLTQLTDFPLVPNSFLGILFLPFLNGACYFLGSLVFCILCIEAIERTLEKIPEKYADAAIVFFVIFGFMASTALRSFGPHNSEILTQAMGLGPLAFLSYPASMVLFTHRKSSKSNTVLFGIASIFQLIEVEHIAQTTGLNSSNLLDVLQLTYGSPIVIPVAIAIVAAFMSFNIYKLNGFMAWIATNSLGIYLVHPIVIAFASKFTNNSFLFFGSRTLNVSSGSISINPFSTIVVAAVSFTIVYLLGKSPLRKFVQ